MFTILTQACKESETDGIKFHSVILIRGDLKRESHAVKSVAEALDRFDAAAMAARDIPAYVAAAPWGNMELKAGDLLGVQVSGWWNDDAARRHGLRRPKGMKEAEANRRNFCIFFPSTLRMTPQPASEPQPAFAAEG